MERSLARLTIKRKARCWKQLSYQKHEGEMIWPEAGLDYRERILMRCRASGLKSALLVSRLQTSLALRLN